MNNPYKNASFVLVGGFGARMFVPVANMIEALGATDSILTSCCLNLSAPSASTTIAGITDITPGLTERNTALLQAETEGRAYQTLLCHVGNTLAETHLQTKASPAPFIFIVDSQWLEAAAAMLEGVKRRFPLHPLIVVTSLSDLEVPRFPAQVGLARMQSLCIDDVVKTCIVTAPHSPLAMQHGEEAQNQFLAHALVSFVNAHKHSTDNRSFTEVLRELNWLSPFTSCSFASEVIAMPDVPKRWRWLPWTSRRGVTGNLSDIIAQTRAAIDRVIHEEDTLAFPAEVNAQKACAILCSLPPVVDNNRFQEYASDMRRFVRGKYHAASVLMVRGNGYSYPHHLGGRYLVQATCLYALDPERIVTKIPDGRRVKVTHVASPLHSGEPESQNGNVHVTEEDIKATRSLVVSSSQNTASNSTHRRGRKKTTPTN